MTDQGFPVIEYLRDDSPRQRGHAHGEQFRTGIRELIEIRTALMREKNPGLTRDRIAELAGEQWRITGEYDGGLRDELAGIAEGAGVSVNDIVILNNYTDFRDIQVPDQGCSVVFVNYGERPVAGQTWDMHGSAKQYVCCLTVPCVGFEQPAVLFSLVGCVGMMGFHPRGQMVGVNNINTVGARAGALWPVVVRRTLEQTSHTAMIDELTSAPVTSGHSYLVASRSGGGEFWEIMPDLAERIETLAADRDGCLFHTNHCLGEQAKKREAVLAQSTTTHIRYGLLEKKIGAVRDFDDVLRLLNDHENYPKSICSNFQAGSQDPSVTCGGAVGDLTSGKVTMWRGDELHDVNFVRHEFRLQRSARAASGA